MAPLVPRRAAVTDPDHPVPGNPGQPIVNSPSAWIDLAVGAQPAAAAQVADHVPVDGRLVGAAGLGIRAADREVDGAADLLVEQDRADRAVDPEVRPDPDLPEPRRAVVGGQRRLQVLLAAAGARGDDAALAELELDVGDLDAARARRHREAHAALGRRLDRAGEDLARGHVALAVGVDPGAALARQREVGPLGLDPDLARPRQPLDQPRLERRAAPPTRRPDRRGRGTARGARSAANSSRAHPGLLGARRRRPQRHAPAPLQPRVAHRLPGARERARSAPRRRPPARACWPAPGCRSRRRCPPPRPARPPGSRRGARRARPPRSPRRRPAARAAAAATPRARAALAAAPAAAARPASSSARRPAGPAGPRGSSRSAARRRRPGSGRHRR